MTTDKKTTLSGIFLLIILLACCLVLPHYCLQRLDFSTRFFISRISFWVLVAVMFFYAAKVEYHSLLLWKEQKHRFIFYPVSVVAILAVTFTGGLIITTLIKLPGLSVKSDMVPLILALSLWLRLLGVVTAAVTEELIFRGYFMPRLQVFFKGPVFPILISSLIFGLAHMGFGTLVNMAVPFFIGSVFAWHYYKYRNLAVLMVCHFLIDFFSIIVPHGHK